jgi:hypothetical protein
MAAPTKNPLIYDYVDYRFFLRDFVAHQKKRVRGFTYRSFASQAGVAASLLKDIISGR